jgi:hypothetical protein
MLLLREVCVAVGRLAPRARKATATTTTAAQPTAVLARLPADHVVFERIIGALTTSLAQTEKYDYCDMLL